MKRNHKKLVDEYRKMFIDGNSKKCQLQVDDVKAVIDIATESTEQSEDYLFNMVYTALKMGVMIGYNARK